MVIWYIILGALAVSILVTFGLWKTELLKITTRWFSTSSAERVGYGHLGNISGRMPQGEQEAVFKLDKIFEAKIPKWMAKPPLSYALCFLIVCIGLGVIILAVTALLKVIT